MRIALVHFSYLPVIGGVELILAAHARLFTEAGHRVTVLCKRGTSDDPRICVELVSEEAEGMARMRELLGASEIVFLHNVLTMPFAPRWTEALGRLAAELPHVRFVSWIHDLAACNPDYSVPGESLLRKAHPGMKHVAISAHRQREFEALTGEPCRVIPNGINPAATLGLSGKIAELATDYQLYERDLVLFHPARLLRRKNIEFSLQVTSALLARGCDCILIVTGPADAQNIAMTDYAASLRNLRNQLGLSRNALFLHDHFPVSDSDLQSLYRLADALLFPSRQEGFGLPLLEAALHRVPLFCTDIAPMNELLPGSIHRFAHDAPPEEVAALLLQIVGHSRETEARKTVFHEYAWSTIYEKFLAPLLSSNAFFTSP